jgi:hypothetical protein
MVRRSNTSSINKKKSRRGRDHGKLKKPPPVELSVDELLEIASSSMTALNIEQAYQAYRQAASLLQQGKISSNNPSETELINVLEKMGEIKVSMGEQDDAKEHFIQALQLLEQQQEQQEGKYDTNQQVTQQWSYYETHSSLCLYVGQLSLEQEALDAYLKGVSSLEKCIKLVEESSQQQEQQKEDALHDLKQKLSGAYCNLAELYLTDLCEEETAESDCEHFLEKALQLKDADGEPLVDALQTMASLRLSQQKRQLEAIPFILRAYEKQRVGSEALAGLVGLKQHKDGDDNMGGGDDDKAEHTAKELVEVEAANNLPEFEFRCQTAKLLLECAGLLNEKRQQDPVTPQENECISAAISVLGSLLAQNDEVIEIWYLTGCAFAAKTPPLVDESRFYLERAQEMLTDMEKALKEETEFVDDEEEKNDLMEQLEMNSAQIQDVQSKLDELGPDENSEEGDEMEED